MLCVFKGKKINSRAASLYMYGMIIRRFLLRKANG